RPDPGAPVVLLVRRLEGLDLRQPRHLRAGGRPLLHEAEGRDLPVGGPHPPRRRPRLPDPPLSPAGDMARRRLAVGPGPGGWGRGEEPDPGPTMSSGVAPEPLHSRPMRPAPPRGGSVAAGIVPERWGTPAAGPERPQA